MYKIRNKTITILFLGLCIGGVCLLLDTPRQMSPVWTGPFLSAAVNINLYSGFKVNEQEIKHFRTLSPRQREQYCFTNTTNLVEYNHNPIGYAYWIWAAKSIFFWQSDINSIVSLQIFIHIFTSLLLLHYIKEQFGKIVFLIFYAFNPVIIYFVTFPFYYFLQILPSVFVVVYLLQKKGNVFKWGAIPITIILAAVFIARPTVLFVSLIVLLFIYLKEPKIIALSSVVLFICCIYLLSFPNKKNIYHSMYIGIGAYSNQYINGLSDNNGYLLYERDTGNRLNSSIGGNYYNNEVAEQYKEIAREAYFKIVKESPLMVIRNGILNFFQSFSFGYFVDFPLWVNYFSAFIGLVFFVLLLVKKLYLWILAIALTSIAFTPYFPPIQAYMFGGYILIICAFIELLKSFGILDWLSSKANLPADRLPFNKA